MFVYQNKNGDICITFDSNIPVETPDYILVVDKEAKTVNITPATEGEDVSAVNELQDKVDELEAEVSTLEATIAEKDARIAELEATIADTTDSE